MNTTTAKSTYNPHAIRRNVRLIESPSPRVAQFVTKSMTKADDDLKYRPTINLQTGACKCECKHFEIRLARHNPTVFSPDEHLCKHLERAVANLARRGLLPQQNGQFSPPCVKCGAINADDYFDVCDARGNLVPGVFICLDCIHAADDLSDALPEPQPQVEQQGVAIRYGNGQVVQSDDDSDDARYARMRAASAARPAFDDIID